MYLMNMTLKSNDYKYNGWGTGLYLMVLKRPEIVFALKRNNKVIKIIYFKVNYLIKEHYLCILVQYCER